MDPADLEDANEQRAAMEAQTAPRLAVRLTCQYFQRDANMQRRICPHNQDARTTRVTCERDWVDQDIANLMYAAAALKAWGSAAIKVDVAAQVHDHYYAERSYESQDDDEENGDESGKNQHMVTSAQAGGQVSPSRRCLPEDPNLAMQEIIDSLVLLRASGVPQEPDGVDVQAWILHSCLP